VPRGDRAYGPWETWVFRHIPLAERLYRYFLYWQLELRFAGFAQGSRIGRLAEKMSLKHLARQVADPRLRQVLTPIIPSAAVACSSPTTTIRRCSAQMSSW
jgi:hypothetical protein